MEHESTPKPPYKPSYVVGEALPPDIHEYPTPADRINHELRWLEVYARNDSLGDPAPEHHVSTILTVLHLHRRAQGRSLEDFGISMERLDGLVRLNYMQAAAGELVLATTKGRLEGVGVYPLEDNVHTLLWKAGKSPADINSSDEAIMAADRELNTVRAKNAIAVLRQPSSRDTRFLTRALQEEIDKYKQIVLETCGYLDLRVEDLGMSREEFNKIQATYKPTWIRRIMRAIGAEWR